MFPPRLGIGLNIASYVKSLHVILALYARSGTVEQLKEARAYSCHP